MVFKTSSPDPSVVPYKARAPFCFDGLLLKSLHFTDVCHILSNTKLDAVIYVWPSVRKGDDNYFLGPAVCAAVNTILYAVAVSAARTRFQLQFTLLRDFFPKLFLRLSVSLLNFLMILLAYSYSLPQFLWLLGAPASYCLVTPLLESFMRSELCLHQILDIDWHKIHWCFPKQC